MSYKKYTPYPNRNEIEGRKNGGEQRTEHSNFGINKRDVFPQFSEPEEYVIANSSHNAFNKNKLTNVLPNKSNFPSSPVWGNFYTGNNSEGYMHVPQFCQPVPTLRQYLNRPDEDVIQENIEVVPITRQCFRIKETHHLNHVERGISKNYNNLNTADAQNDAQKQTYQTIKKQKGLLGPRVKHLIGTVDQVTRWHKMAKNTDLELHYEVAGILESTIKKDCMQLMLIRSESGHILQGVFYAIDRELPNFLQGTIITATGNMIGSNKIHIFDAVGINKDDFLSVQRLAFLSQRSLQEVLQA